MPNNSNLSSTAIVYAPHPESVWYWSLRVIIAITAVLGSGMVTGLIASTRKLWTKPNCFVLSLALADFGTGAVNTPLEFACTVQASCDLWLVQAIKDIFLVSSVFNVCAMTLDRYIAVVYSFKYPRIINNKSCACIISSAWILGVIIPSLFFAIIRWGELQTYRIISVFRLLLSNAIPMAGLVVAYLKMVGISRQHRRKVGQQRRQVNFNYSNNNRINTHTDTKVRTENGSSVRLIGGMVFFFVFCYLLNFYRVLASYILLMKVPNIIVPISRLLYYMNSALNFLVYALVKKDIKNEAKSLLCCTARHTIIAPN